MAKIKMDLETAKWLVDNARDTSAFPVEFEECEKCGAYYISKIGHDCDKVIELPFHTVEGCEIDKEENHES